MREDFLYYLWQHQRFRSYRLFTADGLPLVILDPGLRNKSSGPDYSNAKIVLGGQTWIGNIEIHYCASFWYTHNHHKDPAYCNVILHVVWDNDAQVRSLNGLPITAFCLRDYIAPSLLKVYHTNFLSQSNTFITCENIISTVPQIKQQQWLSRLYPEKLQLVYKRIEILALKVNHHWEHLLFLLLAKGFGGNINGDAFLSACEKIPYKLILNLREQPLQLESLLMGINGLLNSEGIADPYYHLLRKEFKYLRYKYRLPIPLNPKPEFFRLRPHNFPTIRLAQLTSLYCNANNLFKDLVLFKSPARIREVLKVNTGPYWHTHYTFGKVSQKRPKYLSNAFIELLIINVLLPLRCYYKNYLKDDNIDEEIAFMEKIKPESNTLISKFKSLGVNVSNAVTSQGLVHLYKNYCSQNRCLQCAIGHHVLKGK